MSLIRFGGYKLFLPERQPRWGDVGEMVDFGEAGRICLNQERQGACESCLWWEWDAAQGECGNSHYHICPVYRERLFSEKAQARSRPGTRTGAQQPADGGSVDPPGAEVGESGIS